MMTREVTVQFVNAAEASPIALLVQKANGFSSSIHIEMQDVKVNAKSIMGMMSLALTNGGKVRLIADGADEAEALDALQAFLEKR